MTFEEREKIIEELIQDDIKTIIIEKNEQYLRDILTSGTCYNDADDMTIQDEYKMRISKK